MNRFNSRKIDQLQFDIEYRTQFTFIVNDETLKCVLKEIANDSYDLANLYKNE
ncbi:hypothetical protein ACFVR2_19095 [Gottfriedia sp. NPDC057991]|uniref:hypothetical protein n=1 Tax=Gottfriedia sp. NPDC057991 TaxID=3346298 RepID=UPI0036DBCB0D